mmetsp:Transcript_9470/g.26921  ORF Transcript_9470/g.26921 Transcript_9470/m.26921 type:complete len:215 (+) Transcript_9470:538-1182(+)
MILRFEFGMASTNLNLSSLGRISSLSPQTTRVCCCILGMSSLTASPPLLMKVKLPLTQSSLKQWSRPIFKASSVANSSFLKYDILLAWFRRGTDLKISRKNLVRKSGRYCSAPRPSWKPCASTSTSLSTKSGLVAARSMARAPPRLAPSTVTFPPEPTTLSMNSTTALDLNLGPQSCPLLFVNPHPRTSTAYTENSSSRRGKSLLNSRQELSKP